MKNDWHKTRQNDAAKQAAANNLPCSLIEFSISQVKDQNNSGIIDAGELIAVDTIIENKGNAAAVKVVIKLWGVDENSGDVVIPETLDIIDPLFQGEKREFTLIIKVPQNISKNKIVIKGNIDFVKDNAEAIQKLIKIRDKEERNLLSEIINKTTVDNCLIYLSKYSFSYYADTITDILDDLMWKKSSSLNTFDSYQEYVQKICGEKANGKYCGEAIEQIEKLNWSKLEKIYRIEDFQQYLMDCDNGKYKGKYREQAISSIGEIKAFKIAEKENTYKAYKEYADEYSKNRYSHEARRRMTLDYWRGKERTPHSLSQIAEIFNSGYKNHEKAIKHYEEALRININYISAYEGLGKIYNDYGNIEKAKENFERAIQLQTRNYEVYFKLGAIYEDNNDKKSINLYTNAIKLNSMCSECYYYRGVRRKILLTIEAAIMDFKKVIEIEEKGGNGSSVLANMAKGYLEKLGEYK
ncbi:tetratricopeptide repeat protein [Candidatus Micrarchaeota archaeon]|nr:tetratricopeptide repeat protein [Candidatus Micrarchaeota archaeon]